MIRTINESLFMDIWKSHVCDLSMSHMEETAKLYNETIYRKFGDDSTVTIDCEKILIHNSFGYSNIPDQIREERYSIKFINCQRIYKDGGHFDIGDIGLYKFNNFEKFNESEENN